MAARLAAVSFALGLCAAAHGRNRGQPVSEPGLQGRDDILYFLDFNDENAARTWFERGRSKRYRMGYGWTGEPENVYAGRGALEIQHTEGTHFPMEIRPKLDETDVVHVRWYRKWEKGYDWTQHKMPGVYARAKGVAQRGRPNGYNKFSNKLYIDFKGYPRFYSYHPEQKGRYGDSPGTNIGKKIRMEAGRWYCFEMMLKANNAPERDGELKMWIDGKLVAHYKDMRFRDTNDLKINEFTYSAYVGGTWSSKRDQKLWDDQLVVAKRYIGPIATKKTPPPARKKPARIRAKPAPPSDPLAAHARALGAAERLAREGSWGGAARMYRNVLKAAENERAKTDLKLRLEGIEARPALIKMIVTGVEREGSKGVYIDFAGRTQRAKIVKATAREATFQFSGSRFPMTWRQLSGSRLAGIAATYVAGAADRFAIARFLAACGDPDAARAQLDQVLAAKPNESESATAHRIGEALR